MIKNATLTNVKPPPTPDRMGGRTFAAGTTVSLRVMMDAPTRGQRLSTDTRVSTSDAVMYIEKPLPAGVSIVAGGRVTVLVDGSASAELDVQHVIDRQKDGGLSHFECYLKNFG